MIVTVGSSDFEPGNAIGDRLLALNQADAEALSDVSRAGLAALVASATLALRSDAGAMLLAFDADAARDSPHFRWFRARGTSFLYVDRVVVAAAERRRGIGRALYGTAFRHAARFGQCRVCCEVNREPPNPVSDAFHAALGFVVVGTGVSLSGKTVRYLARPVGSDAS